MSLSSSLAAMSAAFVPRTAYWSVRLSTGTRLSERQLVPTWHEGQRGVRVLDWTLDLVATGDIARVREVSLFCPDGRVATLDITPDMPAFQFKTKSLEMLGAGALEYQVIGRVVDKESGRCECFAWDYRPKPGESHLVAYKTSVFHFGAWRDTVTPLGALSLEVQGLRL